MECIEAKALKSSFYSQLPTNFQNYPQLFSSSDDSGVAGLPAGEDFSVDDFFDLPTDVVEIEGSEEEDEEEEKESFDGSVSSIDNLDDGNSNSSFDAVSGHELDFPLDDMEELELWSHLMDDSVTTEPPLTYPSIKPGPNRPSLITTPVLHRFPFIPAAFPVRPRSKLAKRSRLQTRYNPVQVPSFLYFNEPALKKQRELNQNSVQDDESGEPDVLLFQRRCSHCQVTKTPQWRAGPLGPKTLCNACGVRFKKGRLYPEYRPACSPTFARGGHSNSHRKVLEIRKEKGIIVAGDGGSRFNVFEPGFVNLNRVRFKCLK
ncbi:GATA transcription factor 7-like protein [Drosera capensis]